LKGETDVGCGGGRSPAGLFGPGGAHPYGTSPGPLPFTHLFSKFIYFLSFFLLFIIPFGSIFILSIYGTLEMVSEMLVSYFL
jgi:hypothetical protein